MEAGQAGLRSSARAEPSAAEQAEVDYDCPVPPRLRGREPQVEVLRGQLDVLAAGRGSVVLVTGPAGAGKTTLLSAAVSPAADRNILVFCGGGDPAARAVPPGAILDAQGRVANQTVWLRPWPVVTVLRDAAIAGQLGCLPADFWLLPAAPSRLS
jgi:AAA ATPase-like protein